MSQYCETDTTDVLIDMPISFSINNRSFNIFPTTIGKNTLLSALYTQLDADLEVVNINPHLEALKICERKPEVVCKILALASLNQKQELFDVDLISERQEWLEQYLDNEEAATLLLLVIQQDNISQFLVHYGLDDERKIKERIAKIKKGSSLVFGGKTIYGSLIDWACERYGWTYDYVVWNISLANLQRLRADSIMSIYLSETEQRELFDDDSEVIDAGDPANRSKVKEFLNNVK